MQSKQKTANATAIENNARKWKRLVMKNIRTINSRDRNIMEQLLANKNVIVETLVNEIVADIEGNGIGDDEGRIVNYVEQMGTGDKEEENQSMVNNKTMKITREIQIVGEEDGTESKGREIKVE